MGLSPQPAPGLVRRGFAAAFAVRPVGNHAVKSVKRDRAAATARRHAACVRADPWRYH
ncbi:hypothetical protein BLAT2472_60140 [Burkholderia latens]